MKIVLKWSLLVLLGATMQAQTGDTRSAVSPKASSGVTAEEVNSLRDALAVAQKQIQQLQKDMQSRNEQLQELLQRLQGSAGGDVQFKGAAMQPSSSQQHATEKAAAGEAKRLSALESLAGRFRFSGDVRVRQEDFFQSYDGCSSANCNPRMRERIRLRFGVEGKINDDFTAGMFVASGIQTDPTSTNETLTSAFERKTISWDRGYITYKPKALGWLELTGGKFAYTWMRTNQTFDPDINPEGFSEKLSFNLKSPNFKNVTLTGIQLLYNETNRPAVSGSSCLPGFGFCSNGNNGTGADSYAIGGQVATTIKAGRVTFTPAYTLLNWRNADALLNEPASVTGSTSLATTTANIGGTAVLTGVSFQSAPFAPNGLTNHTITVGSVSGQTVRRFASKFLYSDAILDTTIDTGIARWPARLILEYLNNMHAVKVSPNLGRQSHLYKVEADIGQLKQRNDLLFGYGFWRQEQDSVLAAFDESDQRAPTNIVQHWVSGQWLVRHNITFASTLWIGRTLNRNLPNAAVVGGLPAGQAEPYLKRMQFDLIYKF
jgi:hypothetical protein